MYAPPQIITSKGLREFGTENVPIVAHSRLLPVFIVSIIVFVMWIVMCKIISSLLRHISCSFLVIASHISLKYVQSFILPSLRTRFSFLLDKRH